MTDLTSQNPTKALPSLAYILLCFTPIVMASNMLTARYMAGEFPPIAMAFWRWFITFLILACMCGPSLWRSRSDLWQERYKLTILGAMGMGVCGVFVYMGARTTSATNIGLIYASSPLMIIAISILFFKEHFSLKQFLGLALGLFGLLFIIGKGKLETFITLQFTHGDLWILAAAFGWAIYSLMLKHSPSKLGTMERLAAISFFGVLILLPFTIWEGATTGTPDISPKTIGAIAFLAVFASVISYLSYSKLQTLVSASTAGLVLYLIPITNSLMAWAFLNESFASYHWIGTAFVLPGLWLATRSIKSNRGIKNA